MWEAAYINDIPLMVSYDGAVLRLTNLKSKKILKSIEYHEINAFSESIAAKVNVRNFENMFFLAYKQRFIKAFDSGLNEIKQFNFDTGMAIIALHWVRETSNLYVAGTNGWLKCYHLVAQHKVTEFVAKWDLVFEIRSTENWIISLAHDNFTQLLYGIAETTLYAWELNTGIFKFRLPDLHEKYKLCQVGVMEDSHIVVTSGLDGYIRLWNIQLSVCKLYTSICASPPGYLSFVINQRTITTNGPDRTIKYYGIGSDIPKAQICLRDKSIRPDYTEVVIVGLRMLGPLDLKQDHYCVTAYKNEIDVLILGSSPEDFMTSSFPIRFMSYFDNQQRLLCICENNYIVSGEETYDLDMISDPTAKRSPVSEVLAVCASDDHLFIGLKNGALKMIDTITMKGRINESIDLDDSIVYMISTRGMFQANHPTCGGETNQTSPDQEYAVAMSKSGSIHVWCTGCFTSVIDQKLGLKNVHDMCILGSCSKLFIANGNVLYVYHSTGYSFRLIGQMETSGNQEIVAVDVNEKLGAILCTSSGEIIVVDIEIHDDNENASFNVIHHITPLSVNILSLVYCKSLEVAAVCYADGTIYVFDVALGTQISSNTYTDAAPLTAMLFHLKDEQLSAFLAFRTHIHYVQISMEKPPPLIVKEEEEEEEEPKRIEEEEDTDEDFHDVNIFETNDVNLSKLLRDMELAERNKRIKFIEHIATQDKTTLEPIKEKPKLSLEEVIAKNQKKVAQMFFEQSLYDYRPKPVVTRAKPRNQPKPEPELPKAGIDLTLTNFDYSTVKRPQSMNEIRQSIPSLTLRANTQIQKPQEEIKVADKRVLFEQNEAIIDDADPNDPGIDPHMLFQTQSERFMFTKSPKTSRPPSAVLHKNYIAPPVTSRVLFDDAKTLNSLPFFDPRGFSNTFETEEEKEAKRLAAEQLALTLMEKKLETMPEIQEKPRPKTTMERKTYYMSIKDQQNPKIEFKRHKPFERPKNVPPPQGKRSQQDRPNITVPGSNNNKPMSATLPRPQTTVSKATQNNNEAENVNTTNDVNKSHPKNVPPKPLNNKKEPPIIITNKKERPPLFEKPTKQPKKKEEKPHIEKPKKTPPSPSKVEQAPPPQTKVPESPSKTSGISLTPTITTQPQTPRSSSMYSGSAMQSGTSIPDASLTAGSSVIDLGINIELDRRMKKGKRVLKDQPVMRKKVESTLKVKGSKKGKDEATEVKKTMHSTKSTNRRAKNKAKTSPSPKSSSKHSTKPPSPAQSPVVEKKESVEQPTAVEQKKKEEEQKPIQKKRINRWIDNGLGISFGGGFSSRSNEEKNALDISMLEFLPSIASFWSQKHIYPILPIPAAKLEPNPECYSSFELEEHFPDVTPQPLCPADILERFEAEYAFQTGLPMAIEPSNLHQEEFEAFKPTRRRLSF